MTKISIKDLEKEHEKIMKALNKLEYDMGATEENEKVIEIINNFMKKNLDLITQHIAKEDRIYAFFKRKVTDTSAKLGIKPPKDYDVLMESKNVINSQLLNLKNTDTSVSLKLIRNKLTHISILIFSKQNG